MKKFKFLLTATLAGLLVACGGGNSTSESTKEPSANPSVSVGGSDSTGPESIVGDSSGSNNNTPSTSVGTDSSKPSESVGPDSTSIPNSSVVDPIPDEETFTFYLSPVEGVSWDAYFVYTWNSETDTAKVSWPGQMMTIDSETGYYIYEIEKEAYDKVIFSNGLDSTIEGAHQTKDLDFDYDHPVFFLTSLTGGQWGNIGDHFDPVVDPIPDGETFTFYLSPIEGVSWDVYFVYTWNSGTDTAKVSWPGQMMTIDSDTGCYVYEIEKGVYDKVIFSNGMNSTDAGAHQTKDLDFDYDHPVFFLTSVNGAGQWGDFGDNFDPAEIFQWFVIGEMTGWGVNDSYGMSSKGNNIFAYTGSFSAGVPFKIVSDNNVWYGGEKLDSASKAYVTIDASDNNNMKFNTSGTYTITWNANSNTISITAA